MIGRTLLRTLFTPRCQFAGTTPDLFENHLRYMRSVKSRHGGLVFRILPNIYVVSGHRPDGMLAIAISHPVKSMVGWIPGYGTFRWFAWSPR